MSKRTVKPSLLPLDRANYHSLEANRAYMSASQFGGWMECAARQGAILDGKWMDGETDAFRLGRYVDQKLLTPAVLSADMDARADYYYTRSGSPRAFVEQGDRMAARLRESPAMVSAITGEPQRIIVWRMFGVWWRAMLDVIDLSRGMMSDLKTTRSIIEPVWSAEHQAKVPFYVAWNYWRQFSIYREGYKRLAKSYPKAVFMPVVSSEDPPDIELFHFDRPATFAAELRKVKESMPRIVGWKSGALERPRCGRCDYCRATRTVERPKVAESAGVVTIRAEEF